MAGRKLTANVWVGGEFYAAGSTPPKDVADRITNEKVWGGSSDTDTVAPEEVVVGAPEATEPPAPAKKAAAKKTAAKKTAAK